MILIPITIAFLCLAAAQAWPRNWKNAALYACGAAISFLLYVTWAQANVIRSLEQRIFAAGMELRKMHQELGEAMNRTMSPFRRLRRHLHISREFARG